MKIVVRKPNNILRLDMHVQELSCTQVALGLYVQELKSGYRAEKLKEKPDDAKLGRLAESIAFAEALGLQALTILEGDA